MSVSDSNIKGKFNEVAGKVKQGVGEAVGNDRLANEGAAERIKGNTQEAWGAVKESAHDSASASRPRAEAEAHNARERAVSTSANVKDSIKHGVEKITGRRP